MSGTASRSQTRLTYSPALRVAPVLGALGMPGGGNAAPPSALPALAGIGFPTPSYAPPVPASVASPVGPPVMAGSRAFRREDGDGSEGGMGAQPGMAMGAPSTGSVVADAIGAFNTIGPAAANIAFGGPLGIAGAALGAIGAGVARAAGNERLAGGILSSIGVNTDMGPAGGTVGDPVGIGAPGTPGLGDAVASDPSQSVKDGLGTMDDYGGGVTDGGGPVGTDGDKPGTNDAGQANDGGDKGGMGGEDGGSKGDWMRGGYTGAGPDGMVQPQKIAGRVHEGEVVIPAAAVQAYGLDPLLMLARGQVEPSRLMALLRG